MNMNDAQRQRAIYIDLEWNCWDGPPIPGRHQEVIEIGVVEVRLDSLEMIAVLGVTIASGGFLFGARNDRR